MANKRMFSNEVIDTDLFLDLPLSAQALYFHLGMKADDDGFIGNPRRIVRMLNCSEDDFAILVEKNLIIVFPSGVCVITDWKVNNNEIRADRYRGTRYQEELKQLKVSSNGPSLRGCSYHLVNGCSGSESFPSNESSIKSDARADIMADTMTDTMTDRGEAQNRTDKIRADKIRADVDELVLKSQTSVETQGEEFLLFWNAYPKKQGKASAKNAFAKALKKAPLEIMLSAISAQKEQEQWKKDGGKYIPMPSSWLNQERWQDELVVSLPPERVYEDKEAF